MWPHWAHVRLVCVGSTLSTLRPASSALAHRIEQNGAQAASEILRLSPRCAATLVPGVPTVALAERTSRAVGPDPFP